MDLQLGGKTALVTGSTARIGLAIAERLAGEGVSVIITRRSQAKLDIAAQRISGNGKAQTILAGLPLPEARRSSLPPSPRSISS